MTDAPLQDRIAVVTGGTGAIGSTIARALTGAGARVVTVGRTPDMPCGASPEHRAVDVTDEAATARFAADMRRRCGHIDLLVLAHGVQLRKACAELTLSEWEHVLKTNLTGSFLVCKHLLPLMYPRGWGRIIGITSLTAAVGIPRISAYAASKAGLEMLLRTLAVELSDSGITVNMIAPGRIRTPMTADIFEDEELTAAQTARIPLGRPGTPDDLTGAVLFLASPGSAYMTGQTLVIDGGWLASGGNPPV